MKALEYIKQHPEIICWNVFRWQEDPEEFWQGWNAIDVAEIEEEELVDDAFLDSDAISCDLYLTWY